MAHRRNGWPNERTNQGTKERISVCVFAVTDDIAPLFPFQNTAPQGDIQTDCYRKYDRQTETQLHDHLLVDIGIYCPPRRPTGRKELRRRAACFRACPDACSPRQPGRCEACWPFCWPSSDPQPRSLSSSSFPTFAISFPRIPFKSGGPSVGRSVARSFESLRHRYQHIPLQATHPVAKPFPIRPESKQR